VKRAVFRYVEAELYDYPATKAEYEELRRAICERAMPGSILKLPTDASGGEVTDPTFRSTTVLLANRRLARMGEVIRAIDRVFRRLPRHKQRLVALKYWRRRPDREVMEALHVSERTFYRWRREVVAAVGQHLGLCSIELPYSGNSSASVP